MPSLPSRPDFARVQALDDARARQQPVDLEQRFRLLEALRQEAIALGAWPPSDALGGLDVDRRVARAFNVRTAPR